MTRRQRAYVFGLEDRFVCMALTEREDEIGGLGWTTALDSLPADATDEQLGSTVLEVLAQSGVAPPNPENVEKTVFRVAGVRSRRQLVRSAQLVPVNRVGKRIELQAWEQHLRSGGWTAPSADPLYVLEDPEPAELGAMVRKAFAWFEDREE